jgi:hypothetical protein
LIRTDRIDRTAFRGEFGAVGLGVEPFCGEAVRGIVGKWTMMRKRISGQHDAAARRSSDQVWLALEQIATVEMTSEDPNFPIEGALGATDGLGWRAAQGGAQQIRIIFDEPMSLHRIQLRFYELNSERTQEFILRWSPAAGGPSIEIVRQRWNFSPAGSTMELEDYAVDLDAVAVLELAIQPDAASGIQSRHSHRGG